MYFSCMSNHADVVAVDACTVFIGSASGPAELYAIAVKQVLEEGGGIQATHWRDLYELGETSIEALMRALDTFDFGIFVLTEDDELLLRKEVVRVPRDNVVLELGLFRGRLGRDRTFIIHPNVEGLHLPSDLLGETAGRYDPTVPHHTSAVRVTATHAATLIRRRGPRSR